MLQGRNLALDIVKGICIILMVVGHSSPPQWLHDSIYMFHMPCFFFISGLLFKEEYINDIQRFLIRKVKTLWWPFFLWSTIFIVIHNLLFYFHIYDVGYGVKEHIVNIAKAFLFRKTEPLLGGFWFLASLFVASIVSILYYKVIGVSKVKLSIGILSALMICMFCAYFNISIWYFNGVNALATAYFMLGTLVGKIEIKSFKIKLFLISCSILFLALGTAYTPCNMLKMQMIYVLPYFCISSVTSVSLIIMCSVLVPSKPIQWLIVLGERTMDILIFHFIALKFISVIKICHLNLPIGKLSEFPVINDSNEYYWIIYSVGAILISLAISNLINIVHYEVKGMLSHTR